MNRISRHEMWMQMAEVSAKRSTCYRGNVGSLVILNRSILGIGYNGPPSGEVHCKGNSCERTSSGGCKRSIHAEVNALTQAGGELTTGYHHIVKAWDLYTTDSPCIDCAKLTLRYPVKRVFYRRPYRLRDGIELLVERRVGVYRMTPSGYVISEESGMLIDPVDMVL